jgi:hypothetical protein
MEHNEPLSNQYTNQSEWAEELPHNCPPKTGIMPNNDVFYRLANDYPPTDSDFYSHRKLFPYKHFNVDECQARSISLFNQLNNCLLLLKLPAHKHKKVIQLILSPRSGVIMQTGAKPHYSWWRKKDFDPIAHCSEVVC